VIGVPKTIDGDLKCADVAISFGFDTACKARQRRCHAAPRRPAGQPSGGPQWRATALSGGKW
jgi:hypothetical protein